MERFFEPKLSEKCNGLAMLQRLRKRVKEKDWRI